MSSTASHIRLRLVGADDSESSSAWRAGQDARAAVVKENRIAAHARGLDTIHGADFDPNDPRWVLALQTQARLQGTTLTPERRAQLMHSARRLRLRPFEANLVIAIVQDRARAGLKVAEAGSTLRLLQPTESGRPIAVHPTWPQWFAAIAAALAVTALLIRWLAG